MTKTQSAVPPIPADDLAGALGTTPERVLELAGKDVVKDALGRSFVAPAAAQRLVADYETARAQWVQDLVGFDTYRRVRETARRAAIKKARTAALAAAHAREVEFTRQINSGEIVSGYASFQTGGVVSPESYSHASDAARAAGAKFEKRHPDPSSVDDWIQQGRPSEVKP